MFFFGRIELTLTEENARNLRKPSKMFNVIKTSFTREMTPSEAARSEVMLSVLQRINKACRACDITNLASFSVNDDHLYLGSNETEANFKEGIQSFVAAHADGETKKFRSLELVIDTSRNGIRYAIDVAVFRSPPKNHTPVSISISGFIETFEQNRGESQTGLKRRVTSYIEGKLSNRNAFRQYESTLRREFSGQINRLEKSLIDLFPGGCASQPSTSRVIKNNEYEMLKKRVGSRFDASTAYLPFWPSAGTEFEPELSDELTGVSKFGLDEIYIDLLCSTDDATDSSDSWFDVFSSESSCGSSCGSGCGGN